MQHALLPYARHAVRLLVGADRGSQRSRTEVFLWLGRRECLATSWSSLPSRNFGRHEYKRSECTFPDDRTGAGRLHRRDEARPVPPDIYLDASHRQALLTTS
jgi:hypothetical protein